MRTTDSCIDDYYERDRGTGWTKNELLEVIAHELILLRFALQKISGED